MMSEEHGAGDKGTEMLRQPVLALVNMVEFLYFTGPFKKIEEVLVQLTGPVEVKGACFADPQEKLRPYEELIREFEVVKGEKRLEAALPFIVDEKERPLSKRMCLALWIKQQILSRELEEINSALCGPCGCVLCCTGPNSDFDRFAGFRGTMQQEFFEIPLAGNEVDVCRLERIDTAESRQMTARSEPGLLVDGIPFYRRSAALYRWQSGWSLILPSGAVCPCLELETKRCRVYENRPEVCRKPQIFPYVLEQTEDTARRSDGVTLPVYMARNSVLAVWDCPYVRKYQDEIGAYVERSGLRPIFKKSKM